MARWWLRIIAGFHLNKVKTIEAEAKAKKAESDRAVISTQLETAKAKTIELEKQIPPLRSAIPPRVISPIQRDTFIEVLIDPGNVSPKIPIKVVVGETDQETEDFARALRRLLNEAGYGIDNEEIVRGPRFKIGDSQGTNDRRIPSVIAIFSSDTANVPPPSVPNFGSVMMMNPTTLSIARGDKSHPRVYRYTESPNDILYGISSVLTFVGIKTDPMSSYYRILKPGEVGFFIPKQIN